jgi:hypothetical protein
VIQEPATNSCCQARLLLSAAESAGTCVKVTPRSELPLPRPEDTPTLHAWLNSTRRSTHLVDRTLPP